MAQIFGWGAQVRRFIAYLMGRDTSPRQTRKMTEAEFDHLCVLLDVCGVDTVVLGITSYCFQKARFVRRYAGDEDIAIVWEKNGHIIDRIIDRIGRTSKP